MTKKEIVIPEDAGIMFNGERMHTIKDIQKALGYRCYKTAARFVHKHVNPKVKLKNNHLFSKEQIFFLSEKAFVYGKPKKQTDCKPEKRIRNQNADFYKVSIFDDNLGAFIVKHCCLSKKDAEKKNGRISQNEYFRALFTSLKKRGKGNEQEKENLHCGKNHRTSN